MISIAAADCGSTCAARAMAMAMRGSACIAAAGGSSLVPASAAGGSAHASAHASATAAAHGPPRLQAALMLWVASIAFAFP